MDEQGTLPPGAEERSAGRRSGRGWEEVRASEGQIRDEVESELGRRGGPQVPDLPEGISADGEITPEVSRTT